MNWDRELPNRPPKPFPGKYLTRLLILDNDRTVYLGKPGTLVKRIWKKYTNRPNWAYNGVEIIEFDREGLIVQLNMNGLKYNPMLFKFYYPLCPVNPGWGLSWLWPEVKPKPKREVGREVVAAGAGWAGEFQNLFLAAARPRRRP